jgi:hypothetical protein
MKKIVLLTIACLTINFDCNANIAAFSVMGNQNKEEILPQNGKKLIINCEGKELIVNAGYIKYTESYMRRGSRKCQAWGLDMYSNECECKIHDALK